MAPLRPRATATPCAWAAPPWAAPPHAAWPAALAPPAEAACHATAEAPSAPRLPAAPCVAPCAAPRAAPAAASAAPAAPAAAAWAAAFACAGLCLARGRSLAEGRAVGGRRAQTGRRRSRLTATQGLADVAPLAREDLEEEPGGSLCTIWKDVESNSKPIPAELLETDWSPMMDKVRTTAGLEVRACRKGAKQVATLGPSTASEAMIERLFLCGTDVFRLNFSHGQHKEKVELIEKIRRIEEKYTHPICILADMQGPKLRCGKFADPEGVQLTAGQQFRFDLDPAPGDQSRVELPHPEILLALSADRTLLLDDGKIRMRVVRSGCHWRGQELLVESKEDRPSESVEHCPPWVDSVVEVGGRLGERKGVNTPDVILDMSPITPKDTEDITFACKHDVDWIALSFVQRHEDMHELRQLVARCEGASPKLMAKIEKPSAVNDLAKILQESDGVMVARGDLGVEMNPEEVPFVQKDMIAQALAINKPVIVATQMLETMITSPTPTRAECSDVANAILDGCDAVMLSGETSVGAYPAECVGMQRRVVQVSERPRPPPRPLPPGVEPRLPLAGALAARAGEPRVAMEAAAADPSNAIAVSAATLAKEVGARAIIAFTGSGRTAQLLVKLRPEVPVLAVCPCLETARWLSLFRGVYAISDANTQNLARKVAAGGAVRFTEAMEVACRLARHKGLATREDDWLVVIARLPLFTEGPLNCIRIAKAMGPRRGDGYGSDTDAEAEAGSGAAEAALSRAAGRAGRARGD